jgi:type 1 fimbria pilin
MTLTAHDKARLKAAVANPTTGNNLVAWLEQVDTETSVTAGTVTASKFVVVDANKDIASFRDVTVRRTIRTGVTTLAMNDAPKMLNAAEITSDILFVDPEGNTEILGLPAEADMTGAVLYIFNTGGETITLNNDANTTLLSIATSQHAVAACDGTSWYAGLLA